MKTAGIAFLLSMICAAVLTPLVRALARHFGALDQALAARKIHGRPVPRLGGIAIVVGFYVPLLALLVVRNPLADVIYDDAGLVAGIVAGGLAIALLGVYDDLRGAGAHLKLLVQTTVAIVIYALGFRANELANPFGEPIQLGWLALPFTVIWTVGVINAINLIDGLDGLAGGVALVAVTMIFVVSAHAGQPLMLLLCASLAGAIVGFLFYNFNPASIFMGDSGSMFLGFILAASSVKTGYKSSTAIVVVVVILGFPILDTLLAITRRALRGRPLFHGDKDHIHHRLLGAGLNHRQAVLVLYLLSLVLGGVALALTYSTSQGLAVALLGGVGAAVAFGLRRLGYIRFDSPVDVSERRRRNREFHAAVTPALARLRRATSREELWDVLVAASTLFDATHVALEVPGFGRSTATAPTFRAPFRLALRAGAGIVELGWSDGRDALDPDVAFAIERVRDQVAEVCERLRPEPVSPRSSPDAAVARAD